MAGIIDSGHAFLSSCPPRKPPLSDHLQLCCNISLPASYGDIDQYPVVYPVSVSCEECRTGWEEDDLLYASQTMSGV